MNSLPEEYGNAIAIIGMAGRFPGANSLEAFWQNLQAGVASTTFFSDEALIEMGVKPELLAHPDFVKAGAVLDNIEGFDAEFFGFNRREAALMDPQHRFFLECAWEAFENAGINPLTYPGPVGVYAGTSESSYERINLSAHVDPVDRAAQLQTFLGNDKDHLPIRVSYKLNLTGPSLSVQTACSTSLVAVHLAAQGLLNGECSLALAGGVSIRLPQAGYIYQKGLITSPDGYCRSFDAQGEGAIFGSGLGVVVLKRLDDALADGDRVEAIIRGSAINNDGARKVGYTAPSEEGQARVIAEALAVAEVEPESISYIEAHGTATPLGDPIEIAGLTRAFNTSKQQFCAIGSVKSNVGHLEVAAGIAGLIKTVLALKHKMLPPSLHFETANPQIDFATTPFYVNTALREWTSDGHPRRAGVSSFGMGGTNAHLVLEEAPSDLTLLIDDCRIETSSQDSEMPAEIDNLKSSIVNRQSLQLFTVSAKTEAALNRLVDRYEKHLTANPTLRIEDVCYTANTGRAHFDHRLSVVATSCAELREKLRQHREGLKPEGVWQGRASEPPPHLQQTQTDEPLTLHRLAERYVTGLDIDWAGLDANDAKRHKVVLPTYPFAQERCWISNNEQNNSSLIPHPSSFKLHPLVHQNISDLVEQRFRSVFNGEEFFLKDHQVQGQKVFAGAAYLEMARAAGEMAVRDKAITQLKDVVWARPIIVDDEPLETYISLYPDETGEIAFEVSRGEPPQRVVHSQGKITVEAVSSPEPLDISAIQARCPATLSGADCYPYFGVQGLVYGPAFQGLVQLSYSEREALAHLRLPSEVTDETYELHPSLLDAALQATIGLALSQRPKELHLPFALQSLTIHRTLPERAYAYVRYSDSIEPNGPLVKYDITLADEQGTVCVVFQGFTGRAMSTPSPNELFYSTPSWQVKPLTAGDDEIGEPQRVNTSLWVAGLKPPTIETIAATFAQAEVIALNPAEDVISLVQQGWSQLKILIEQQSRTIHQILVVVADTIAPYLCAPLAGLLKSARLEQPHIRGKVITIASLDEQRLLPLLRQEMKGDTLHEVEIRYDDSGTRAVKTLSEIEPAPQEKMAYLKPSGVYWITGGLGALGRIFARHYLEQGETITIILSGRSALDEIGRQHLAQLNDVGGKATYLQADISVRTDVDRTLHIIREKYGPLNGIVHCAGIINDSLIINKSEADLAAVLAPKVIGTLNLDAATRSEPLDFMVLFSSIAGVLGNVGQAGYAAANAFLDAFAQHRQTLVTEGWRQGRTLSLNWPLWAEGGLTVDDQTAAWLTHETGLAALDSQAGINAFEVALGLKHVSQIMVLAGDRPKIKAYLSSSADQVSDREAGKNLDIVEKFALTEAAAEYLKEILAGGLNLPADRVQAHALWETYGIDSVMALSLTRRLEQHFGELPKTLFFEYRSLAELSRYFVEAHTAHLQKLPGIAAESASPEKTTAPISTSAPRLVSQRQRWLSRPTADATLPPDEIAIIGLNGRYPMADNLAEFWENLKQGRDCITGVPPERWDHDHYYDQDKTKPGRSYSKWGGFMAGVDRFDPLFFNISPRDAERMDPQERLFLETAWATLEDAGYTRETLFRQLGRRVGVFVGVMWGEYQLYGQADVQTTSSYASIANRVSYYFDWQGPSLAVDTMCSSSLTSIHLACESIKRGECAVALAGGVNISIHPNKYLQLSQGQFASSDGRCRSFGEGGDGYVPGEGVGAVLLKPLAQAEVDGDQIYGVIKASCLNHGGRTHGYSVPNPTAQANLIGETLQKSGVSARTISYVEAHGTGTALGDPIEIRGLSQAFGSEHNAGPTCAIGSVKSNIGHLEAAAGIAGLTKVLLQMKHLQLAPSLHAETLNPHIDFAATPFKVQRDLTAWKRPVVEVDGTQREHPRRAGISSFGAGGANAHLVVEEYVDQGVGVRDQGSGGGPYLIVLSARNEERLRAYATRMLDFVEDSLDISLADMAYTLQVGREAMPARLALVVTDVEDLVERLRRYGRQITPIENLYQGNIRTSTLEATRLVEGEVGTAFMKMVIDNRDLPKLAQLWASGVDIAWSMLYPGQTPRRISLPTYPFARERYWIPDTAMKTDEHSVLYSTPIWQPRELAEPIETLETHLAATGLVIIAGIEQSVVEPLTATFEQAQIVALPTPGPDTVENVSIYLHQVWEHLQTVLQDNPSAPCQILIVAPETDQGYIYAPLVGLMKTACLEHPNIQGKIITISNLAAMPPNNLITLLRLEAQPDTFQAIEVRYGDGRAVKQLVEMPPAQIGPERTWLRPGGVYWITGGLGALGRIFARYLVEHGEAITVILSGRSPLGKAGQETLDKLNATGAATVTYLQADVSQIEDVERVVETIKARYGALNGIIHSAGLLRDAFILKKDLAEINAVLAPKVAGLVNIDAVTHEETLDFMVLFSSMAGVRGNIGQGDYAAANAFLDAFAVHRQQLVQAGKRSGKTVTINWPLWQSGGMQVDEPTLNLLRQRTGLTPLKTEEGLHAFELVLATAESQFVVTAGETTMLRAKLFSDGQSENRLDTARNVWPVQLEKVETTPLRESVLSDLRKMVSELLKIKPQDLSEDEGLHDYGFDSVTLTAFSHRLNEIYGLDLAPTLFFQYNTLSALSLYLVEHHADKLAHHYGKHQPAPIADATPLSRTLQGQTGAQPSPNSGYKEERKVERLPKVRRFAHEYPEERAAEKATPPYNNTPIAIIGISGIMPGSPDLEAFWQNLITGQDLITEIPPERWDWRDYYGDPAQDRTQTLSKWGGFIPDVDKFDPLFFKISPKEAQMMDPQHRLFLQAVWHCIEDAGYRASDWSGRRVGVYAGVQFQEYLALANRAGETNAPLVTGNSHAILANRISYLLNLRGPSEAIDTACSSSLVAIHRAVRSIRSGEVESAIAGGVALVLSPQTVVDTGQLGVLSPDGRCKTFDRRANGFVKGEGVGVVLLKPLAQAQADGDHIYGVIRGSAENHGGKAASLTAPNPEAQAELLVSAYEDAAVDIETVGYIEVHGTGTELGDPVEVEGLKQAFQTLRSRQEQAVDKQNYCGLGAVKTN
ncbi:MAG: SDR family NAD(P)-dependent oxidoreductase, partial [Anaerolineae bacterium]|nr:SDR family NAD(P)-dependent oxidoreductase [Anaerolineae bacterium]